VRPGQFLYLDRPHANLHVISDAEAEGALLPGDAESERAVFIPLPVSTTWAASGPVSWRSGRL
jgi:hypothetical protein